MIHLVLNDHKEKLYKIVGKALYFRNQPISDEILQYAREYAQRQIFLDNPQSHMLPLVIVASKGNPGPRFLNFTTALKGLPYETLANKEEMEAIMRTARLVNMDRVLKTIDFVNNYGGIEALVGKYRVQPAATRRILVSEKIADPPNATLWYLRIGGKRLVRIDAHGMRQARGIGVDVNPDFYEVREVKGELVTQKIAEIDEYEKIEAELLATFKPVTAVHDATGRPDGSLISALLDMTRPQNLKTKRAPA
jgi:hypothetical protein